MRAITNNKIVQLYQYSVMLCDRFIFTADLIRHNKRLIITNKKITLIIISCKNKLCDRSFVLTIDLTSHNKRLTTIDWNKL